MTILIDTPGAIRSRRHATKRMTQDADAFRADASQRQKRYRELHPERARASKEKFRAAHPDKNQEYVNRFRAMQMGADVEPLDYLVIADRDQNICHICGESVDLNVDTYHPRSRTFDHVQPLVKGGSHTFENVRVAHRLCNVRKNNLDRKGNN